MKHTVELTYQELVNIIRDQFLSTPDDLEVKITDYPHVVQQSENTLWYPDKSGEWKEHDGSENPPNNLQPFDKVMWITYDERKYKTTIGTPIWSVEELCWDAVAAYKVVCTN